MYKLLNKYNSLLLRRPWATKIITSGSIFAVSDLLC